MKKPRTELNQAQERFAIEYVNNEGNATRAYRVAYPNVKTDAVAASEGHRLLRNPKVLEAVNTLKLERFKRLQISGDEALALLSQRADPDIAHAYDERGQLKPVTQWPRKLRRCIKSIRPDGSVVLHDALKAAELMAVATGKLRNKLDVAHTFDHEAYLAGDEPGEGGKDGE